MPSPAPTPDELTLARAALDAAWQAMGLPPAWQDRAPHGAYACLAPELGVSAELVRQWWAGISRMPEQRRQQVLDLAAAQARARGLVRSLDAGEQAEGAR